MKPNLFKICLTTLLLTLISLSTLQPAIAQNSSKQQARIACEMLTKSDVESVLGVIVREPQSNIFSSTNLMSFPGTASMSTCNFREARPDAPLKEVFVSVSTSIVSEPDAVGKTRESLEYKSADNYREVSGIGDAAIWSFNSNMHNNPNTTLSVFIGGTTRLQISIHQVEDEPAAFEMARKLALKALGGSGKTGYVYTSKWSSLALKKPVLSNLGAQQNKVDKLKYDLAAQAEAGNAKAQLALATLYQYATRSADGSLRPDYSAAAYWYQQAADRGVAEAAYVLALLYKNGLGVPKDEMAEIEYFKKGAELGHVPSMSELGHIYLARQSLVGVWRAQPWLEKAAKAGDAASLVDMGYLYNKGIISPIPNYDMAMRYYQAAAALGDCVAYANIGGLYFNGDGVQQDRTQAQAWFAKAESCKGADAIGIKEKAARYRQMAAKGQMPAVIEEKTGAGLKSLLSGLSDDEAVMTTLALGLATAIAADLAHGPYTEEEDAQGRRELEERWNDYSRSQQQAARKNACIIRTGNNWTCYW